MSYLGLDLTIVEARCDWITATTKHGEEGLDLVRFAQSRVSYEEKLGSKVERFRAFGYVGEQSRHVRWGWGSSGGLAVFSGDEAGDAAYSAATLADHWTRVDYCVTVVAGPDQINPPQDYRDAMKRKPERPNGWPQMSRYEEMWGGDTFYIGKRVSPYYCRCYNKHVESKGDYPPGSWRWECELKRHASEGAQVRARDSGLTTRYITAFLAHEFARVELEVPWRINSVVKRDPQIRHRPDADRKLEWLEQSVAPTVDFLIEARGEDRVLDVLGLPRLSRHSTLAGDRWKGG